MLVYKRRHCQTKLIYCCCTYSRVQGRGCYVVYAVRMEWGHDSSDLATSQMVKRHVWITSLALSDLTLVVVVISYPHPPRLK